MRVKAAALTQISTYQKIGSYAASPMDAVAKGFEMFHMATDGPLAIPAAEVISPQLAVGDAVAHDEISDFQNLMSDRDDRFLVPAMPLHAVLPGLQSGPFGARRRQPAFDQRPAQIPVAVACLTRPAFSRALVGPGTSPPSCTDAQRWQIASCHAGLH